MNQLWFEDMMSQSFHEDICFNPTKLIILCYLSKDGIIHENYKLIEMTEYVYQTYIDNKDIAEKHPSYMVRKIRTYGIKDLREHVKDSLISWSKDAKNQILHFNDSIVWLDLDLSDSVDIAKNTARLSRMLYKKIFMGTLPEPHSILNEVEVQDDHDLNTFGKGKFRDRVLEDMQYCPLCESIDINILYGVHIVDKAMGATPEELCDKNNGLLLCREHAEHYLNGKFHFDERGFAHEVECCGIEKGMHLSFSIRSAERKQYFKRRMNLVEKMSDRTDDTGK